jgi:hypothetical protein
MAEDFVPFGSPLYFLFLALLIFGRSMDFLSTWVATPNLVLEANPIARKMGWKFGLLFNLLISACFALWPLPAIAVCTTSLLVAARNFQSAWLMRSMGEFAYRAWMSERIHLTHRGLFLLCLLGQTSLVGFVGAALMYFCRFNLVALGIGLGLITYAVAILIYTTIAVRRNLFR